ncbi:hypothetical protein KW062_27920 [Pseudomonas fluorescens]|nr:MULTISPECIES: hypothetical protein [Pseudomonas]QXN50036.1 hypothetical protein KW062_27920 [Pseudomonas fluorescens]WSO24351.1 hypothetical protein VUJ50_28080 [Pseudomonas fluorescens]
MNVSLRIAAFTTLLMTGAAQGAEVIDVYRDPKCGCCKANNLSSIATIMTL